MPKHPDPTLRQILLYFASNPAAETRHADDMRYLQALSIWGALEERGITDKELMGAFANTVAESPSFVPCMVAARAFGKGGFFASTAFLVTLVRMRESGYLQEIHTVWGIAPDFLLSAGLAELMIARPVTSDEVWSFVREQINALPGSDKCSHTRSDGFPQLGLEAPLKARNAQDAIDELLDPTRRASYPDRCKLCGEEVSQQDQKRIRLAWLRLEESDYLKGRPEGSCKCP